MKIPKEIPFFEEDDIESISNDVKNILKSKRLVLGNYTREFENKFAEYIGTKHAVAVNSCTAALQISLMYADVKNKEVLVPTNTFIACPNTVIYSGGKPVFVDIDKDTFCMDINDLQNKINSNTRAIMPVHLGGLPIPEMNAIIDLCKDHNLYLVEDCSHAHGAMIDDKKVGSLGDAGCFSLFATKIMSVGVGGILTTNDSNLAQFAEELRHQGGLGGPGKIESFDKFGYDWMMSEITASIGIHQLNKLEKQLERRNRIAEEYRKHLTNIDGIELPPSYDNIRNSYWRFIIKLDKSIDRDQLKDKLRKDYNIEAGVLYPLPCHLQPLYRKMGHKEGECPVVEEELKRQLTLPINSYMDDEAISYVISTLDNLLQR
ncbi:MAG: aminotransferase DegT [Candidatus Nitrosocaldaceae archaeon]|nr:MAG: aminotransferase DegT [Candidatus Nitrosocaldaceae archaeon]GIU72063.1 MAG: aminotransferase DegT [Candidatus Nitrosocaldaceae archaeon]